MPDCGEDFVAGDAVDSGVHEAINYILRDWLDCSSRRVDFGDNFSATGDSEPLAEFNFAEEFGEFRFRFKCTDFSGHACPPLGGVGSKDRTNQPVNQFIWIHASSGKKTTASVGTIPAAAETPVAAHRIARSAQ